MLRLNENFCNFFKLSLINLFIIRLKMNLKLFSYNQKIKLKLFKNKLMIL